MYIRVNVLCQCHISNFDLMEMVSFGLVSPACAFLPVLEVNIFPGGDVKMLISFFTAADCSNMCRILL